MRITPVLLISIFLSGCGRGLPVKLQIKADPMTKEAAEEFCKYAMDKGDYVGKYAGQIITKIDKEGKAVEASVPFTADTGYIIRTDKHVYRHQKNEKMARENIGFSVYVSAEKGGYPRSIAVSAEDAQGNHITIFDKDVDGKTDRFSIIKVSNGKADVFNNAGVAGSYDREAVNTRAGLDEFYRAVGRLSDAVNHGYNEIGVRPVDERAVIYILAASAKYRPLVNSVEVDKAEFLTGRYAQETLDRAYSSMAGYIVQNHEKE